MKDIFFGLAEYRRGSGGNGGQHAPTLMAADLYCDAPSASKPQWHDIVPGLTVTALAVAAAGFISDRYGAPLALIALLIGLSLNFLGAEPKLTPGLTVAATTFLRIGIVLVGARITIGQIAESGPRMLIAILLVMSITLISAIILARVCGFTISFGILAGGAVAICGASAALAIAAVLGNRRTNAYQLPIVLVGISTMSALAMSIYPSVAHAMALSDRQAGFFLGASIHDVAQALAGGYSFSDAAGKGATIVKLTRVTLLIPFLVILSLVIGGRTKGRRALPHVPWFILGFLALTAMNSAGLIPTGVGPMLAATGSILIVVALTSAAIRSPITHIVDQGFRPLIVIGGATLVAAAAALSLSLVLL